jgi:hypothetical protein
MKDVQGGALAMVAVGEGYNWSSVNNAPPHSIVLGMLSFIAQKNLGTRVKITALYRERK